MKDSRLNIVIAEPSCIIFEGLSGILTRQSGFQANISKAVELSEISQIARTAGIDFVFINPVLVQNQTKLFYSIKKEIPETFWIGIAYSLFDPQLMNLFDSVITVNDSPSQIIDSLTKLLNSQADAEKEIQTGTLSDREVEVLKLLVTGNSNKEIADRLFISPHTVITHRKNISQKTGIKSVSGLTIYAVVNNIIEIDKLNG